MGKKRWNDHGFTIAVAEAISVSDVLRRLGLKPAGGNYKSVYSTVKRLKLSTSHWLGQKVGLKQGSLHIPKRPYSEILVENSDYTSTFFLGRRLVKDGLLQYACVVCSIREWLGAPLSLHLDHKNGNPTDNRLENLRFLCPNCHSQTPTYCGKNIGRNQHAHVDQRQESPALNTGQ
jgi:hypothetical protein